MAQFRSIEMKFHSINTTYHLKTITFCNSYYEFKDNNLI